MANEHGLFFDSVNGDRVYNSDSFAEWLRKFFTTGVFNGDLQVQPSSGMAVTVGTGYANIEGRVRFFDTTQTKTLPVANGTYPRVDTIVVRLDLGNRQITCETVQGTYSGNNPSPTAPVRSDGIYEIVLAQIYVGAGVTEITTANITDTRADETLCGWVTSTVESVPMSQIVSQMQAKFLTWYDHMKDQLDEDAAGHLQQEFDTLNSAFLDYKNIVDSHDTDFANVENSNASSKAYAKGEYFMLWNKLRKATVAIAVGDPLVEGETFETVTVAQELQTLNKGLIEIYYGAWIRSSTSALDVRLTDILTVNKGTYLLILNTPPASASPTVGFSVNGSGIQKYSTGHRNSYTTILDIESDNTPVYAKTASSANVTYSTIAEGGIYLVKIKN